MGAVWVYQLVFLFLGPEMSEEERAEYAHHANELERQRKAGASLKDIGVERVKSRQLENEKGPASPSAQAEAKHLETA